MPEPYPVDLQEYIEERMAEQEANEAMIQRAYMPQAKSQEWETPRDLFDGLWHDYGPFDLDPCCRPGQYTAKRVFENGGTIYVPSLCSNVPNTSPRRICIDGLSQPWHGKVFMNPPYGAALREWVPYAVDQVGKGNVEFVLGLLPARTDVKWWQQYVCWTLDDTGPFVWEVHFLGKRLKFVGAEHSATFPSAIVVWRK